MTIRPQHFPESFLSKLAESNSRNNKDELSRLASYLPRKTATRNGCGGYYPPSILPPIPRPSPPVASFRALVRDEITSRWRTRIFVFAGKRGRERSCFRGAMPLDPPTFWSIVIVRPLAPADRIDGTNATRLKASCVNFYSVFFSLFFFFSIGAKSLRYQS